jgi:hypothetical protein
LGRRFAVATSGAGVRFATAEKSLWTSIAALAQVCRSNVLIVLNSGGPARGAKFINSLLLTPCVAIRFWVRDGYRPQTPAHSFFGGAGHYPTRRQKNESTATAESRPRIPIAMVFGQTHILFGVPATAATVNAVTVMIHDRLHKLASLY